jgi:rod shape-determining protein MreC
LSYRDGHFQDLKVPLTWTVAVAVLVAAVVAVALLVSSRRESLQESAYGAARSVADAVNAPAGQAVSAPSRVASQAIDYLRDYFFAVSENRRLRQQLQEMQVLHDQVTALKNVNARYAALLGFRTDPPVPMATAHVILDARGPFSDTRLADIGKEHGVQVGNPVMLLTDVASRTPVLIDRTDARAIMTGDASPTPKLEYMRGLSPVRQGDRVLTSGDGGLSPRGLPVGTVVRGLDGVWRVQLDADESAIDFVRILLFTDFSTLADQKELAATPLPAGPPAPATPKTVTMAAPSDVAKAALAAQAAKAKLAPPPPPAAGLPPGLVTGRGASASTPPAESASDQEAAP